jgi:hypothetical protein
VVDEMAKNILQYLVVSSTSCFVNLQKGAELGEGMWLAYLGE